MFVTSNSRVRRSTVQVLAEFVLQNVLLSFYRMRVNGYAQLRSLLPSDDFNRQRGVAMSITVSITAVQSHTPDVYADEMSNSRRSPSLISISVSADLTAASIASCARGDTICPRLSPPSVGAEHTATYPTPNTFSRSPLHLPHVLRPR